MTADEVERLAREAGLVQYAGNWCSDQADGIEPNELARFAALVAAAERERAAKLCEGMSEVAEHSSDGFRRASATAMATICAKLIRAG